MRRPAQARLGTFVHPFMNETFHNQAVRNEVEAEVSLERLFAEHAERLRRVIACRMDRRLSARVDPADVVQETFLDATRRYDEYRRSTQVGGLPPFLWLRFLAVQRLMILRRRHLSTRSRDARREVAQDDGVSGQSNGLGSGINTGGLAANTAAPSEALERAELRKHLETALRQVNPADRRVVVLRHFEQRTNEEVASALGVRPAAARRRYYRALRRLRRVLPPALAGAT